MAFVTQRLVASWLGGVTKTSLYPIKVHTSASGLRVYYSLKIIWVCLLSDDAPLALPVEP